MTDGWPEHPMLRWVLRHMLLEHGSAGDRPGFEAKDVNYLTAYHDGLHGETETGCFHDGWEKAKEDAKHWLENELGIPVRASVDRSPTGQET